MILGDQVLIGSQIFSIMMQYFFQAADDLLFPSLGFPEPGEAAVDGYRLVVPHGAADGLKKPAVEAVRFYPVLTGNGQPGQGFKGLGIFRRVFQRRFQIGSPPFLLVQLLDLQQAPLHDEGEFFFFLRCERKQFVQYILEFPGLPGHFIYADEGPQRSQVGRFHLQGSVIMLDRGGKVLEAQLIDFSQMKVQSRLLLFVCGALHLTLNDADLIVPQLEGQVELGQRFQGFGVERIDPYGPMEASERIRLGGDPLHVDETGFDECLNRPILIVVMGRQQDIGLQLERPGQVLPLLPFEVEPFQQFDGVVIMGVKRHGLFQVVMGLPRAA